MCSLGVVVPHSPVEVGLQLGDRPVELLAQRDLIELDQDGLIEALADAVGLWASGLSPYVVDILHRQIELIGMALGLATVLRPRSVSTRLIAISCSSKNGRTQSFSMSAAVIGVLVS